MCNIAGYVGERPAAPILIEMMLREEGFGGGYYTGIATLHEGKIYYEKLTGDTERLLALTNAAKLPGNIGIIHSRSNAGGGDLWSHPFVGFLKGEVAAAYVANGSSGFFSHREKEYNELIQSLVDAGYPMPAQIKAEKKAYLTLKSGMAVHMSDAMCQLALRNLDRGERGAVALSNAFMEMPSEIVGLLLSLDTPDGISYSRINAPMTLSFASHGAYLSTSAMAFPTDAGDVQYLPANSFGTVYRDHADVHPMHNPPASVAPIDARVMAEAYCKVGKALQKEARYLDDIAEKVVCPLFEKADCYPVAMLTYEVLRAYQKTGRLKIDVRRVPGATPELDAPKAYFSLI